VLLIIKSIAIIFFTVTGLVCLFFPRKVQQLAVKWADRGARHYFNPLSNWITTSSYVVCVRAIGAMALLMAIFVTAVALRSRN